MADDKVTQEIVRDFNFTIKIHNGAIRMEFARQIDWVMFTPVRARKLAEILKKMADEVEEMEKEEETEKVLMN